MNTSKEKQYGLINMKKAKTSQPLQKKLAVFDDSDEEDTQQSGVNQKLLQEAVKTKMRKQTKMEIQKAMEEDPTVYEYDSIYDDMEAKKVERERLKKTKQKDSKPKYIQGLLKAANQRKLERERQKERQIQREREKEGEEFGDKEQFVTASYKKKMQEVAADEERERKEAERDGDLSKGLDMAGFYRHILDQTAGEPDNVKSETAAVKDEDAQDKRRYEEAELSKDRRRIDKGYDGKNRLERERNIKDDRDRYSRRSDGDRERLDKDRHEKGTDRKHKEKGYRSYDGGDERRRNRDDRKGERHGEDRGRRAKDKRESDKESDKNYRHSDERNSDKRYRSHDVSPNEKSSTEQQIPAEVVRHTEKEHEDSDPRRSGIQKKHEEESDENSERKRENSDGGEEKGKEVDKISHDGGAPETNLDADSDLDISEESDNGSREAERPQQKPKVEAKEADDRVVREDKIKAKYARRTTDDTVMSARERYLARKMQRDSKKDHVAVEEDD